MLESIIERQRILFGRTSAISVSSAISIWTFLLVALFIFLPLNADALASGVFDNLDTAPITDISKAAERCSAPDRPNISFRAKPEGLSVWPTQYIELRWNVLNAKGQYWPHPVFLREGETIGPGEPKGESVSALWVRRMKAGDLKEGLHVYYLVTRCGVARVETGKYPKPNITSAPDYAFKGDLIEIKGTDFRTNKPGHYRRVSIAEPGAERHIDVIDWTNERITAKVTGEVLYGRHELLIDTGLSHVHHRHSNSVPITVVKQEEMPSLMLASAVQDIFSDARIHLNNYGSKNGSSMKKHDSYIKLPDSMGGMRTLLTLPEYNFSLTNQDGRPYPYFGNPHYYINDINLDVVQVSTKSNGYVMTLYFENLHDEFIGESEGGGAPDPPEIQLDNLRVVLEFMPAPLDGLIVADYKKIEVIGDFRGMGSSCDYGPVDICKKLYASYEEDVIKQLRREITELLEKPYNRLAFGRALKPWMKVYGIGEVTRISLSGDILYIDHIPWH